MWLGWRRTGFQEARRMSRGGDEKRQVIGSWKTPQPSLLSVRFATGTSGVGRTSPGTDVSLLARRVRCRGLQFDIMCLTKFDLPHGRGVSPYGVASFSRFKVCVCVWGGGGGGGGDYSPLSFIYLYRSPREEQKITWLCGLCRLMARKTMNYIHHHQEF